MQEDDEYECMHVCKLHGDLEEEGRKEGRKKGRK